MSCIRDQFVRSREDKLLKIDGVGSVVKFYNEEEGLLINLHKRHPSNILKVYKGVINVRIDPELYKNIYQEALKAGVSLNAFV